MAGLISQSKLELLLGRSLTTAETAAFSTYLSIATETLEDILGYSLQNVTEEREFDARENYRTLFTGVFNNLDEVTLDDEEIDSTEYSSRQWDKRNGDWYNSIVFDEPQCGVLTVSADWGFGNCMPNDLQLLLARLFNQISESNNSNGLVESKQVEDFRISYRTDVTQQDQFIADNASTLKKYQISDIGEIQSGDVNWRYDTRYRRDYRHGRL